MWKIFLIVLNITQLTHNKTEGVSNGSLCPDQAIIRQIHIFSCAIDVSSSNPGRWKSHTHTHAQSKTYTYTVPLFAKQCLLGGKKKKKQPQKNYKVGNTNFTCHSKHTDKQPNVPPSDHDGFAAVGALRLPGVFVLPCRPDAHEQDEQIEDHDSHKPLYMDGHGRTGLP